jgi:hypothetical protein
MWDGEPLPGERGLTVVLEGERTWHFKERQLRSVPGTIMFADGERNMPLLGATDTARALVFKLPKLYHDRMVAEGAPQSFVKLPALAATESARTLAQAIYAEAAGGALGGRVRTIFV